MIPGLGNRLALPGKKPFSGIPSEAHVGLLGVDALSDDLGCRQAGHGKVQLVLDCLEHRLCLGIRGLAGPTESQSQGRLHCLAGAAVLGWIAPLSCSSPRRLLI